MDLFGCKAYSSATLQFWVANYTALMAKYDHINYSKLAELIDFIPEDKRDQFKSIILKGQLLSRTTLLASLDVADPVACFTAMP